MESGKAFEHCHTQMFLVRLIVDSAFLFGGLFKEEGLSLNDIISEDLIVYRNLNILRMVSTISTGEEFNGDTPEYIVRSKKPLFNYPNISIAEHLAGQIAKLDPNIVALINPVDESQLTYGELHQQAQELASTLLELGVVKSDLALFFADNSRQLVVSLLATIYLGIPYCPVSPACGPFELTEMIRQTDGKVLVFGPEQLERAQKALENPEYAKIMCQLKIIIELNQTESKLTDSAVLSKVCVRTFDQMQTAGLGRKLVAIPHYPFTDLANDHFLICFTSGTSGVPKGAIHSNASLLAGLFNFDFGPGTSGEKALVWHPIGHISGSMIILSFLSVGRTVILYASSELEDLLRTVERYRLKYLQVSANQAALLAHGDYETKYDLSSLLIVGHAGSKVSENVVRAIMRKLKALPLDGYAATEFFGGIGDRDFVQWAANWQPDNLATVCQNVELKIVDLESGRSLPAHRTGEVCLRGPPRFLGYLNNPEATKSTIDTDGWYHSGDIGYYDEAGNLFLTDRIKEMIKYQLYSLIPAEIEDFLHRHPAVQAVCAVGVPHATEGNYIRAYVQLYEDKVATEQELIDYVHENMGHQKRLRAGVRFIAKMPRTIIGKVDRQHFKRLVKDELIAEIVP